MFHDNKNKAAVEQKTPVKVEEKQEDTQDDEV